MSLRAGLINGTNINQDYDFGYLLQALTSGGVIEGLEVQSGKVVAGKGFIPCERTNGDKPFVFVELQEDFVVDTTGTKKVWIEIAQAILDDGSSNNEDGTGIATIETGASYPAGNYIPLASITGGSITDERVSIQIGADKYAFSKGLRDLIDVYNFTTPTTKKYLVFDYVSNKWTTGDITINDIPKTANLSNMDLIAGESFIKGESLFAETITTYGTATSAQNLGDTASNKRIYIKIYGTGITGNSFDLAIRKVLSPSVFLNFQIETASAGGGNPTGIPVENTSGSIDPAILTTTFTEQEITTSGNFTLTDGVPYWIVCFVGTYGSETINATNYYQIGYNPKSALLHSGLTYNGTTYSPIATAQFYVSGKAVKTTMTETYDGTGFPTGWTVTGTQTVAGGELVCVGSSMNARYDTLGNNISIETEADYSITDGRTNTNRFVKIRLDASNYVTFSMYYNMSTGGGPYREFKITIVNSGSTVVNNVTLTTYATLVKQRIRLSYMNGCISASIYTGGGWTILASYYYLWNGAKKAGIECNAESSYGITHTSKFDNTIIRFFGSNMESLYYMILAKTSATYAYKLPTDYLRFADKDYAIGEKVNCIFYGLADLFSFASYPKGTTMYVGNTAGTITSTAGTNSFVAGKTMSETILFVRDVVS